MKKIILAICALVVLLAAVPGVAAAGSNSDPDRDGVDNRNERREGTDPHRRDSDRDGRADGREDADRDGLDNATEDATGNDPLDRDSDDDGLRDGGEGAGTVESFVDRTLVIRLPGGTSVSGTVDELTELSCPSESAYEQEQGRPSKAYRHGRHRHSGRGRHARRHADGRRTDPGSAAERASAAVDPDDEGWDDDPADEDSGDDEWVDEEPSDDEEWGDEDEDFGVDEEIGDATGPCVARLAPGTWVHAAEIDTDADGALVVSLELVR